MIPNSNIEMIANLNVSSLDPRNDIKPLKLGSAYLISKGGQRAILKGESLSGVGKKGDSDRTKFVRIMGGTPQAKKSIRTAMEIIAYVTGEESLRQVQTFTRGETEIIANKLMQIPLNKFQSTDIPRFNSMESRQLYANVWYLMPYYGSLLSLGTPENIPPWVSHNLKSDDRCFNSLGRILVCDMFFGNSDRLGKLVLNNSCPVNRSNVFLTWNPVRFLGIDFFDSQLSKAPFLGVQWGALFRLMNEERMAYQEAKFNFDLLKKGNVKARDTAAKSAIRLVGNCFNPTCQFSDKSCRALREGIRNGRDRLRDYYIKQINRENWPNGLVSRFKACGW